MAEKDIAVEAVVEAGAEDKAAAARADLPAAAKRALAEAAARRRRTETGTNIITAEQTEGEASKIAALPNQPAQPKELGGRREGRDPTRYGDWEFKGRAIDF